MKVTKFTWKKGWIWDCPRLQRLAYWIDIEVFNNSFHEIVNTELKKRKLR